MAEARRGDGSASMADLADALGAWVEERTGLSPRYPDPGVLENRSARVTTHGIRSAGSSHWAIRIEPKEAGGEPAWVAMSSSGQTTVVSASMRNAGNEESALEALSRDFSLVRDGIRLLPRPLMVSGQEGVASMVRLIRSPTRKLPVVVVSLPEHCYDPHTAALCPYGLARQLLGIAHVIVISGDDTFVLTELLGKELSVFRAAVRVYRPTRGEPLDPRDHPIAFPSSPDGKTPNQHMAERIVSMAVPSAIVPQVPTFRDILSMEGNALLSLGERDAFLDDADDYVETATLRRKLSETQSLLVRRSAELIKAEARVRELEGRGVKPPPAGDERSARPMPRTLDEVALLAAVDLKGRVVLTKKAMKAMRSSSYGSPETAYRALEILGNEYREMRLNGGSELERAFDGALQSMHLENMPIPARLKSDRKATGALSEGGKFAEWHVRSAGNPNDPVKCLRVYYFWHEEAKVVVVTHMPGYLG